MNDYSKKPPYHKRLSELLADPTITTAGSSSTGNRSIYVLAGSLAWNKARSMEGHYAFLLSPPDTAPEQYDWSILAGHEPIHVLVSGYTTDLHRLAAALNRDGVSRVYTPNNDGSADCHYTEQGLRESKELQ